MEKKILLAFLGYYQSLWSIEKNRINTDILNAFFQTEEYKELKQIDIIQQDELISCPNCCGGDVYAAMNENKYLCMECKHEWTD